MIEYEENNTQVLEPKRNFTIKKNKRIFNLRTDHPLMMITNSQPVTPSRPTLCTEIKSNRNTIDYFVEFTQKNKQVLQNRQTTLPTLNNQSESNKLIKPMKVNFTKKRSLQKQYVGKEDAHHEDLKLNIWNKTRVSSSGAQKVRIESKIRMKSNTIDADNPGPRIKPLVIQNRFISKFPQLKKPLSHQMRYFRNKVIKQNIVLQNPQMLFTFYPNQEYCKTQMVNQFLDIN